MKIQQTMRDNILMPRKLAEDMINLFEALLANFEELADKATLQEAKVRLAEIKSGKVKALTEKDYEKYKKARAG